jgi:endonuclease/exonuclease/phosphatase family metal-dependent hydrolase
MKAIVASICLAMVISMNISAQTELRVATYNLRMDTPNDGENAWSNRKEMVKGLVRFHQLDIVGTQEGFKHQLEDILEIGGYDYVGAGRDDGKDAGEHSAILFNTRRLALLDNGDFWFSETPEVPGKGWDATCCNRICSWAKFKEIETGTEFFVFNVHYDHQGKVARYNSSLLLLERMEKIAGGFPLFATGDFNAVPEAEPIQLIYNSGKLNDSYQVTLEPPYGTVGTFNSFSLEAPMKNRIDYIWATPGITVERYGVLNDMQHGRFPSDHFPVVIDASF